MIRNIIIFFVLIVAFGSALNSSHTVKAANQSSIPLVMKEGTFLKGMSVVQISTAIADIGDEVYFINPCDMYLGEVNVIPKNSRFYGYIEDLKEPVQGTNGAMKIKINKIVTPERKIIPVEAYLYSQNDNYIGGEITHPAYYAKKPSYSVGWKQGVLQYVPTNIREYGKHTVIMPGVEIFIILTEDLPLI